MVVAVAGKREGTFNLGGSGGDGGDGVAVSVISRGRFIETKGDQAAGILAKSTVCGRAEGGLRIRGVTGVQTCAIAIFGGSGGGGGKGGDAEVTSDSTISTRGDKAYGIKA